MSVGKSWMFPWSILSSHAVPFKGEVSEPCRELLLMLQPFPHPSAADKGHKPAHPNCDTPEYAHKEPKE